MNAKKVSKKVMQVLTRCSKSVRQGTKLFSDWALEKGIRKTTSTYFLSRWLFLRLLGLIYFIAFVSLGVQILGLLGSNGILPVEKFLEVLKEQAGWKRFWIAPSLLWIYPGDMALQLLCWAGAILSVVLMIGFAQGPVLALLWFLYLSLISSGQDFLSFQWDVLLLEAGFLAIWIAPSGFWPRSAWKTPVPDGIRRLFYWLIFRVIFSAGYVKLISQDPFWANLTAVKYHYQSQPLPTLFAWYLYQLPLGFHKMTVVAIYLFELAVPFLIFTPRRLRRIGALLLMLYQVLIALTGNFGFFNCLIICLCVLLFDDAVWPRALVKQIVKRRSRAEAKSVWSVWVLKPLVGTLVFLSAVSFLQTGKKESILFQPLKGIYNFFKPFRSVNTYGIFSIIIERRHELILEGSNNGEVWRAYTFRYKPDDLKTPPKWISPYHPRLDWQMWIAAQGNLQQNPWLINFCVRLLEDSKDVLRLIEGSPFDEWPPRYIRPVLYEYEFTDEDTKEKTGMWWERRRLGLYSPVISLPDK